LEPWAFFAGAWWFNATVGHGPLILLYSLIGGLLLGLFGYIIGHVLDTQYRKARQNVIDEKRTKGIRLLQLLCDDASISQESTDADLWKLAGSWVHKDQDKATQIFTIMGEYFDHEQSSSVQAR
jgi:hypothetical protein